MSDTSRRQFLRQAGVAALALTGAPAFAKGKRAAARVVVVGGGFGGATCAKYLRRLNPRLAVTLVEQDHSYLTCPLSNTVLVGMTQLDQLRFGYQSLRTRHGVEILHNTALGIDPVARTLRLQGGQSLAYDFLVVSPGIDFKWGSLEGYDEAAAQRLPHAWKAGEQTQALAQQIAAMKDGETVAIAVPPKPFRCPPGPYERAGIIAHYLKSQGRGRCKVLVLDANDKFTKQELFLAGWKALYGDMVEWVPVGKGGTVHRVDPIKRILVTDVEELRVAVANVIPPQRAARFAVDAGLTDETGWCPVRAETFAATRAEGVFVLGDAAIAGAMPKSASAANSQAKICALTIAALVAGDAPGGPTFHNTCYSLVGPSYGISVTGIYHAEGGAVVQAAGGGVSPLQADATFRAREAEFTYGWYRSITGDAFG